MDAMALSAAAKGDDQISMLLRDYREQAETNMAAAAVTGIDTASFSSVAKGNQADLNENIGRVNQNVRWEQNRLKMEGSERLRQGKFDAAASKMRGMTGMLSAVSSGIQNYNDYRYDVGSGDDRRPMRPTDSFLMSLGMRR